MSSRSHIADLLREAREQRSLSVEAAATQVGIPLRYVQLLEGETPAIGIPDEFYLIPFFRKYASFVGLEVERLLPEFLGQVQHVTAEPPAPTPLALRQPFPLSIDRIWKPAATFLAVAVAAFVMTRNAPEPEAIAADPLQTSAAAEVAPPPASVAVAPASATETAAVVHTAAAARETARDTAPTARTVASSADPSPPSEEAATADAGARKLHILATETVWLEVGRDDGPSEQLWLEPGDTQTLTAHESFTLKVGNAGGLSLAFDGQKLPPLGKSGQVVRVRLPSPAAEASGG